MKPQKTIEDYRRDIKLLKLKYLKLQDEKQRLEQMLRGSPQKNYDQNIYQENDRVINNNASPNRTKETYMSYDKQVMRDFLERCSKILGMTPESLFRAADVEGKGVITDQQFKQFLMQTKLNMNSSSIQRIIQLSDINCSGFIQKNNYNQFLAAFQINQENNDSTQQQNGNNSRTFIQQSIFKFAQNLISQKVSPYDCFSQMDTENKDSINYDDMNSYFHKFCKDMTPTECIGAFNYLDVDQQQNIIRDMFVVEMKKIMRIIASDKGIDINNFVDNKSNVKVNPNTNNQSKNTNKQQPQQNSVLKPMNYQIKLNTIDQKSLIQKFVVNYKINLHDFFIRLFENLADFRAGIIVTDVLRVFDILRLERKISGGDKLAFFRALDQGNNGSIDYPELIQFYVLNYQDSWPIDFIFSALARMLSVHQINSKEAFLYCNVLPDQNLSLEEYRIVFEDIFQTLDDNIQKKIFSLLDKQKKGLINSSYLIDQIQMKIDELKEKVKSEQDLNQVKITQTKKADINTLKQSIQVSQEKAKKKDDILNLASLSMIKVDIPQMEKIIQQLKPSFNAEKDFFDQIQIGEDKQRKKDKWKTILNDELSCFKKCIEIIKDLKPGQKWQDPEFGPTDNDPYGAQDMYFYSNDIPQGCPQPEDVQWLHADELVKVYLQHNAGQLTEGQIEQMQNLYFLYQGASSNDVKQSAYLGDCWLISALSIIAQDDSLIIGKYKPNDDKVSENEKIQQMSTGIHPPLFHFLEQYGIYVIRFFKDFEWRYVLVDDRLPCLEQGKLIYSKCTQINELWVSLTEKAYAKLHNCYQALISGDIAQGLSDLTGQVSTKIKYDYLKMQKSDLESGDYDNKPILLDGKKIIIKRDENNEEDPYIESWKEIRRVQNEAWQRLKTYQEKGVLMGCSAEGGTESLITIEGERTGIYSGHAYSIIDVFTLNYNEDEKQKHENNDHNNHRLVCCRNPWGYGEWCLKWSENEDYKELVEKYQDKIKEYYTQKKSDYQKRGLYPPEEYQIGIEDGTFLICYKDWRTVFCNLFVCLKFSDEWTGYQIVDRWTQDTTPGAVKNREESFIEFAQKNPQYRLKLNGQSGSKVEVFISLSQDDGRLFNGEKYPYENVQNSMLLCIFQLNDGEQQLNKYEAKQMVASNGKYNQRRDVDFGKTIELECNKNYIIIPSTQQSKIEADFSINIYAKCKKDDIEIKKVKKNKESDPIEVELLGGEDPNSVKMNNIKQNIMKLANEIIEANV